MTRRPVTPAPLPLVLEDGRTFRGEAFGARGETFGEAVFTTGMSGYQETLTDPSFHRQVVIMTSPHIGNTGMNDDRRGVAPHLGQRLRRARARRASPRTGAASAPSATTSPSRASSASAASTPARSPATCATAARCGSASPRPRPTPRRCSRACSRAPAWRAPTSAARSRPSRPTSCPRWGRSASPSPRSTSASRAMTPRQMAKRGIEVHVLPVDVDVRGAHGRLCPTASS